MSRPRFAMARAFKFIRQTNALSSLSYTSATFVDLGTVTNGPGAGGYDLVLAAEAGDVIEYCPAFSWGNEAVDSYMDVATIVAGAAVNTFLGLALGATNFGIGGWGGAAGVFTNARTPHWYTVQSGDLTNGAVTLRPYVKSASATLKRIIRGTDNPVVLMAKNLGPPDPN